MILSFTLRSYCPRVSPRGLEPQASVHPGVPRGSERDLLQPSRPRQKPWSCAGSPPALTLQVGLMTKSYRVLSLTMSRTCHFSPTLAQLSLRLMAASSGSLNSFPHVRSCHRGPSSEQQKSHQPPDPGPPVSPQARHTRWPPPSGLRSAWGGDSSSSPTSAWLHAAHSLDFGRFLGHAVLSLDATSSRGNSTCLEQFPLPCPLHLRPPAQPPGLSLAIAHSEKPSLTPPPEHTGFAVGSRSGL